MKNQQDPQLSPEEELRAENNLLKLKLKLEYGMQETDTSNLPPHVENDWLKYIEAFEKQYRDAKSVTVYEFIGKPPYKALEALTPEQVGPELNRLLDIMGEHDVALDCLCKYDDAIIYKFLTEELFPHEMDLIRIPGMTHHFIYEEFHPNHDYDLRRKSQFFLTCLYRKKWDQEIEGYELSREVLWSGKRHNRISMSAIISAFQDAHLSLRLRKFVPHDVAIDPELRFAHVRGFVSAYGKRDDGKRVRYAGPGTIHFTRENEYWSISEFSVPGFS
ncbi:MAG TPA: hypothetical protein VIL31_05085 [Cyclobacteriaceae bacterium]